LEKETKGGMRSEQTINVIYPPTEEEFSPKPSLQEEEKMLVHVTMTHTADNCPAYHTEKMPALVTALDGLDQLGKELNVKAHSLLWGAPDHVAYAVLEADTLTAIGRYLNSIPIVQDFKITPVEHVADVIEFGKAAMARAKK
jgi:hypothetical protein